MRQRKEGGSKRSKKTQNSYPKQVEEEVESQLNHHEEEDDEEEEEAEESNKGFFACYLLCSNCPRFKGHTYIGFTVNPRRRIRQHNGELRSGAWRTKSKRPWEMILCIYGFPTNVKALQFEWAWQHPRESLAVREAAASLKSISGVAGKIKLVYMMLTLKPWERLKLTVNFFSTKYMKEAFGCKSLPKQMKVQFGSMDELPCYTGHSQIFDEMDDQDYGDKDADNETDNTLLEGLIDTPVQDTSDCHVSSAARVHDMPEQDKDGAVNEFGEIFTDNMEDEPLSPKRDVGTHTPIVVDHTDHMVDSPLPLFSRVRNLVNSVEIVDHRKSYGLIEMNGQELKQTAQQQVVPPSVGKEHQLSSNNSLLQSPELSCKPNDSSFCMKEVSLLQDTPEKTPVEIVDDGKSFGQIEMNGKKLKQTEMQEVASPLGAEEHQLSSSHSLLLFPELSGKPNDLSVGMNEVSVPQFCLYDTPEKTQVSNKYPLVKNCEDIEAISLTPGSVGVEILSSKQSSESTSFTDDAQPLLTTKRFLPSGKVEVIEIPTPPSNSIARAFRQRKRRNNRDSKEVIDLTESPKFVQL